MCSTLRIWSYGGGDSSDVGHDINKAMPLVNISRTPLIERTQWDTIEREIVIANVHMM